MLELIVAFIQEAPSLPTIADGLPTSSTTTLLITSVAGFASLLLTQLLQMRREARNRKWDLEDRTAARLEAAERSERHRNDTIATAQALAAATLTEIAKNTQLTHEIGGKADKAYKEANNFNNKLETVIAATSDKVETPIASTPEKGAA